MHIANREVTELSMQKAIANGEVTELSMQKLSGNYLVKDEFVKGCVIFEG